jgi:hypothetical protein
MRAVYVADSPADAHLVAGLLDEAGIRNVVEGEMLFGVRADIGLTPASLPRICVNEEDFERARTVLVERMPQKPSVDPELPERQGLPGSKTFLRAWVFAWIAVVAVAYAFSPLASLVLALLAVPVGALWYFARRS